MMTTTTIEELKRLEAEATRSPWSLNGKFVRAVGGTDTYAGAVHGTIISCEETCQSDFEGRTWSTSGDALSNAALIVAMRNALPELLKALEEAREALAPFSRYACPLFERGFMNDDVVTRVSAADGGVVSLTAGDFFHARRTLPPHGGVDVG